MKEYPAARPLTKSPRANSLLVKSLSLAVAPARAFAHFTDNIGLWWPLATHSFSQRLARDVIFEAREGGRIFETDASGREIEWGVVKVCDAPRRLVFSWALGDPAARSEILAARSEIEVTFEDDEKGGTDFRLVHRGLIEAKSAAHDGRGESAWTSALEGFAKALSP